MRLRAMFMHLWETVRIMRNDLVSKELTGWLTMNNKSLNIHPWCYKQITYKNYSYYERNT